MAETHLETFFVLDAYLRSTGLDKLTGLHASRTASDFFLPHQSLHKIATPIRLASWVGRPDVSSLVSRLNSASSPSPFPKKNILPSNQRI